jgi:hypothetical protein
VCHVVGDFRNEARSGSRRGALPHGRYGTLYIAEITGRSGRGLHTIQQP